MAGTVIVELPATKVRSEISRGAWCSAAAALVVGAGMVVTAYFADGAPLYPLLLLGVAAGAAMATQVGQRNPRAGLVAATISAAVVAVTLALMTVIDVMKTAHIPIDDVISAVGGVDGLYTHQLAAAGPAMWLFVAGALMVAGAFGTVLGEARTD